MKVTILALIGWAVASRANGLTFDYETAQLISEDVGDFSTIAPAPVENGTTAVGRQSREDCREDCRAFPGAIDWPQDADWKRLNTSLGGALLKPVPAGAVCYAGTSYDAAKCTALVNSQVVTPALFADPLGYTTAWPLGKACPITASLTGKCTQGGFPSYVVNATSVKHIQIAVNFARNKNLRLVIKNTGHDFVGRSTGAGSLAIWTHYLKGFEVKSDFSIGKYRGSAAHVGVGLMANEVHAAMAQYGATLVAPSFATVGPFGGYMAGGGHSTLVSYYGLASDQVLSLNVVTAGGNFVTASPTEHTDLFYALRGGGGSTYGIVTSATVKAYPPVDIGGLSIAFSSLDLGIDVFWRAVSVYFSFGGTFVDAGGKDSTYVSPLNNATVFNFTSTFEFPGKSPAAVTELLKPLDLALRAVGANVTFGQPSTRAWSSIAIGNGSPIRDERFASGLIPRVVWDDKTKFAAGMGAFRKIAELGYQLHGTGMAPTLKVAGYPGSDSGVNPAFRSAVMHCVIYDYAPSSSLPDVTPAADLAGRARLSQATDLLRKVTPGSGAYINEADVLEPNWQQSFFGNNYPKLASIKADWDPWGLFWAPDTPGSENWSVRTADGEPTQNGRLCRTCSRR